MTGAGFEWQADAIARPAAEPKERIHLALYLRHFPATGESVRGGTSIAVAGLASGLAENGAQVTVLCEGQQRTSRVGRGYAVECFVNRGPQRSFALASELRRHIAEHLAPRRALCLINGMFHPGVYAMARWLRRCGVPYVVAPHDPYDSVVFSRNAHLKWPYWYLFERRLLKRARAIQVLDPMHAVCLRRLGIDSPVIAIPDGVSPGSVPAESELRWRASNEPVHLGFLGRIDAYNKGLDILLEAFPRVASRADVSLTIQGPDWGDRARLEKCAARAMHGDRVTFLGPDYRRSSYEIVAGYDVFCLPSRFEGFGLAALEAMLTGRVLLVSKGAGIARHVRASGCGETVTPWVAGVEEGLLSLLRRRAEWREMGMSGRRYALAKLQWKQIAAAALARYEELTS
jgi:glycosyltransferase involved in cell wall biosynthesis